MKICLRVRTSGHLWNHSFLFLPGLHSWARGRMDGMESNTAVRLNVNKLSTYSRLMLTRGQGLEPSAQPTVASDRASGAAAFRRSPFSKFPKKNLCMTQTKPAPVLQRRCSFLTRSEAIGLDHLKYSPTAAFRLLCHHHRRALTYHQA